jgi:hypothetical protein
MSDCLRDWFSERVSEWSIIDLMSEWMRVIERMDEQLSDSACKWKNDWARDAGMFYEAPSWPFYIKLRSSRSADIRAISRACYSLERGEINQNPLGIFLKSQVGGIHLWARLVLVECLQGLDAFVGILSKREYGDGWMIHDSISYWAKQTGLWKIPYVPSPLQRI